MDDILVAASIIGAIVLGVTQIVKQTTINNKWLPWFNIGIGVVIGAIYALTIVNGDLSIYCWGGGLAGLAAGGFYDGLEIFNKNNSDQ